MTARWSLRCLGERDWELMRAVRLAMLLDAPGAYGSTFAREVAFTESVWRERAGGLGGPVLLVERADGLPLGTATLLREQPGSDPEIVAMWVAGHARGEGIADALVRACRERARAAGDTVIRLHVMVDNPRAVAFYARSGFTFDGECGDVEGCARMHWCPGAETDTNR